MQGWSMQYRDQASTCWNTVMDHWLNGRGTTRGYPVTWEGLFELLRDVDCAEYAKQLKEALAQAGYIIAC